jgi:hypothetical protein
MATINKIVKIACATAETLKHYDVNYAEGFVVVVRADELTDPLDINEVITKANARAAIAKAQWIASLAVPPMEEATEPIEGSVTL